MKISDLCAVLEEIRTARGDLEVYCGETPIAGFSILPADLIHPSHHADPNSKVVAIIPRRGDS